MVKKDVKLTEDHKRKIGLANSIALRGHKPNKNQLEALKTGREMSHTPEVVKKIIETRMRNGYKPSEETKRKISRSKSKGGWINKKGYKEIQIMGKTYKIHRLIMEKHLGRKLELSEDIHHINKNKLDNRIENLRVISHKEHSRLHNPRGE